MRVLLQRVKTAKVTIDGKVNGEIAAGLCVFLGVGNKDEAKDVDWMAEKVINLRIFNDADKKMNLSLRDINGEMLIVSQFTLYGDCKSGRRPSFTEFADFVKAEDLYNSFVNKIRQKGIHAETGIFRSDMQVEIINDGPVTFMIES